MEGGNISYFQWLRTSVLLLLAMTSTGIKMRHIDNGNASARVATLGHREFQVLGLIVLGRTNREIASALRLGTTAIKTHVSSLLRLAGARNRAELIGWVHDHGSDGPDGILTTGRAAVGAHPQNCRCEMSYCPNPLTARKAIERDESDAA